MEWRGPVRKKTDILILMFFVFWIPEIHLHAACPVYALLIDPEMEVFKMHYRKHQALGVNAYLKQAPEAGEYVRGAGKTGRSS